MKHVKTFESFLNESGNQVIFSIDDDKLDQMLNARFSRQLDYKDDKGDSLYVLPKREFDQFIDLADSSGFDVDYENSEDSVVYVQESLVNEADSVKAERLIGIVNDAHKEGTTVTVTKSGKTFELSSFLYMHYKTVEFKSTNGTNVTFKHNDMVTFQINESYKQIPYNMKISGKFEITINGKLHNTNIAGFERQDDDNDSLYLMDEDPLKAEHGSFIVKNSDMPKLSKGISVKAVCTKHNTQATLKRIGDL